MKKLLLLAGLAVCIPAAHGLALGVHAANGNLALTDGDACVAASGEHGLWRLRFQDGSNLSAADFTTNGVPGCAFTLTHAAGMRVLTWTSPVADVTVRVDDHAGPARPELSATVVPKRGETQMLELPAKLVFPLEQIKEFIYPGRGNSGPGLALHPDFFRPAPPDSPHGWNRTRSWTQGYEQLYGGRLHEQPMDARPAPLAVTDTGKAWLGEAAAHQLNQWRRTVIRPPAKGQSDLVLIDSPLGPFLSANRFGGTGALWRFGAADAHEDPGRPPAETYALRHLLPRLAAATPSRRKIALVNLRQGPRNASFVQLPVADWQTTLLTGLPATCTYEEIASIPALHRALEAKDHLLILNPYGEDFPVDRPENFRAELERMRRYVQAGGNWVEVGGYSFFNALYGGTYFSLVEPYPPLFADFACLKLPQGGSLAFYGVQPRAPHAPWQNATPFTPGETGVGGCDAGGWYFHAFAAYAKPGERVTTPAVRLALAGAYEQHVADYLAANTLTTRFDEKVPSPEARAKFRQAPLLHLHGQAVPTQATLAACPVPTLYHPSCYLKGGFDKEYPDHVPPNAWFGTAAEMKTLFRTARAQGHLVAPYTNPTWWCDHPRGPSFVAAGEAPLARDRNGKPLYERYGANDGWTTTLWHPDVQAANRRTVRAFTEDYPVDLLFQDQCGARTWVWDFNPAAPSPMAYAEGMIAMNEEDSRRVPLGTEDGWDQVANRQTALCGCSWRVVPLKKAPSWRSLFVDEFPAYTWHIEPLALRLFHDKTLFFMHDLGAFVHDDQTLAWMFALGYNLSLDANAGFEHTDRFKWYEWLHLLQSKVVARLATQPLTAFTHDRTPYLLRSDRNPAAPIPADDGVVTAVWGDVTVAVNLGDKPRTVGGHALAPYGWHVAGPNLRAGHLQGRPAFVETDGKRWTYAPDPAFEPVRPTAAQQKAPARRSDVVRTLAVLDFGPDFHTSWVACTPADWIATLQASELVRTHGFKVVRLADYAALKETLAQRRAFAVLNPYGEMFPCEGPDAWPATLAALADYVAHGGHWIETGSASFYSAGWRDAQGKAQRAFTGPDGVNRLGFGMHMTDINEAPVPLQPTADATRWFPADLCRTIAATTASVNRSLAAGRNTPVTPLVTDGQGRVWFGFHQLNGWGALWRLGGANPPPALARKVVPAALLHAFTTPPPPVPANTHLKVTRTK